MLTKKECEKAFKMLNSLITHSPFKEDHRDYNDLKINNSRLQNEYMDAVMVLQFLMYEHFTPNTLTFEELKENMWVYDVKNKCCIYIEELTVDNQMMIIRYPMSNRESNCEWCDFEENRFYPIQIPEVDI